MQKANIKSSVEIAQFETLGKKVNQLLAERQREEEDMSDAPPEFKGQFNMTLVLDSQYNYMCRYIKSPLVQTN